MFSTIFVSCMRVWNLCDTIFMILHSPTLWALFESLVARRLNIKLNYELINWLHELESWSITVNHLLQRNTVMLYSVVMPFLPHANLRDSESCRNCKMQISGPKNMFFYFLLFRCEKYYPQLSYAFGMRGKEFLSSKNDQFSVLSFFLPVTVLFNFE